jgi:hypothetical protein
MNITFGKHIKKLQKHLEQLNADLINNHHNRARRNRIEAEIRWVNLALSNYQKALEAEKKVSPSGS